MLPTFQTHTVDCNTTDSQTTPQKLTSTNSKLILEHLNQDTCCTNLAIESAPALVLKVVSAFNNARDPTRATNARSNQVTGLG